MDVHDVLAACEAATPFIRYPATARTSFTKETPRSTRWYVEPASQQTHVTDPGHGLGEIPTLVWTEKPMLSRDSMRGQGHYGSDTEMSGLPLLQLLQPFPWRVVRNYESCGALDKMRVGDTVSSLRPVHVDLARSLRLHCSCSTT